MRIFLLEDRAYRIEALAYALQEADVFDRARTVEEAKVKFKGPYDIILLDHDLAGSAHLGYDEDHTGFAFAKRLAVQEREKILSPIGSIIIHAWNMSGASDMEIILKASFGKTDVHRLPFGRDLLKILTDAVKTYKEMKP